jgi:hypothetical protein
MENCKRCVRAIPEDIGRPDWINTVVQELVAVKGMHQRSPGGSGGSACDERLRCDPRRPKLRHTGPEDYASVASTARCAKRVAACGHPCVMHSGDDCRCNVVVYNLSLPCGHKLESVNCATLHGTTNQCPVQEHVELPFCKHHCTLPCAVALRLEVSLETENWTDAWDVNYACRALCDGLHPSGCGHRCRQKCSDCLEESLGDPWRATRCSRPVNVRAILAVAFAVSHAIVSWLAATGALLSATKARCVRRVKRRAAMDAATESAPSGAKTLAHPASSRARGLVPTVRA